MPLVPANDLISNPLEWEALGGVWDGECLVLNPNAWESMWILCSPPFHLTADQLCTFTFSAEFIGEIDYVFAVHSAQQNPSVAPRLEQEVHTRLYENLQGGRRMSLCFRAKKDGLHRLILRFPLGALRARVKERLERAPIEIVHPKLNVQTLGTGRVSTVPLASVSAQRIGEDTTLPHWGRIRRSIHERCRRSRPFNTFVSAVEMRLGREELLSLPQYVALCPTGQCNALCDFCSVTLNRTGILKQQLPFKRLDDFIGATSNTVRLYGLEGNGEPTLYAYFPELVETLTRKSGNAYLITNGSRLNESNWPLLLGLDSINFSLNAATAESHRSVMKLKNFDAVAAAIKGLVRERGAAYEGAAPTPQISVSYVVTADNIHETQQFLEFAEQELGVDVVWIRPLSELGNDLGAVEDLRKIVPYEGDVRDMLESVAEYLADVPRRADIRISPESFHSVQPDPFGRVLMPMGFEERLLAPRRQSWTVLDERAVIKWHLNTLAINVPGTTGPILQSEEIPVEPGRELKFQAKVEMRGAAVRLRFVGGAGETVSELDLHATKGPLNLDLPVPAPQSGRVSVQLLGKGAPSEVLIDFERLRTPCDFLSAQIRVPGPRRWQLCTDAASVTWNDNEMRISSESGGGPYLVKSYAIPCAPNELYVVPIDLEVHEGEVNVAILTGDEARFLESFSFYTGKASTRVFFDSGSNDRVRLVVLAEPGEPVDAFIRWPEAVAPAEQWPISLAVPTGTEWRKCAPEIEFGWTSKRLRVSSSQSTESYLLKSNGIYCERARHAICRLTVDDLMGEVGFGVLDEGESRWLGSGTLSSGRRELEFKFATGSNSRISLVLFGTGSSFSCTLDLDKLEIHYLETSQTEQIAEFALSSPGLVGIDDHPPSGIAVRPSEILSEQAREYSESKLVSVEHGENKEAELISVDIVAGGTVDRVDRAANSASVSDELSSGDIAHQVAETNPTMRSRLSSVANSQESIVVQFFRWAFGRPRYYCQKPWTDLNNFTVDGRMDVCCITTGPSQEYYQLGNLNRHRFQEIWNGPMMRTFRRTVNRDPLPPCQRCPMLGAFQGPGFDPAYTIQLITGRLCGKVKKLTGSERLGRAAHNGIAYLLNRTIFRGFRDNGGHERGM